MTVSFRGIGVSAGIAVGRVVLHEPAALPIVPVPIPPERVVQEIEQFERVRGQARTELQELRQRTVEVLGEPYAGILDAQLLILDDPTLIGETVKRMRVGRVSARWALKEVVAEYLRRFAAVDDGYLRERGGDLDDVHRRLQRLLRVQRVGQEPAPAGPVIMVAQTLGPTDALMLSTDRVAAIATDAGGRTSHTAILAQALSLPAVVGLHDLSLRVRSGDRLIVDGDRGVVSWEISDEEFAQAESRSREWQERVCSETTAEEPAVRTADGTEITLRANIEFPGEIETAVRCGARGVGLYRSEFLFLSVAPSLPTEAQHYHTYCELAEKVAPEPVVIRTLDLGGEKYFHDVLGQQEARPVLGLRGVRLWLQRPDIALPQLRGLMRAAARFDLRMMLPLVTSPEEVRQVRAMVQREAEQLTGAGLEHNTAFPLGTMIEVPAAAICADLLAEEADFFSIGTNDLVQYTLAVDRDDDSVAYLARPDHPAILRMIRFVIDAAHRRKIPVSLCGEMAADPASIELLIGLGLRELSLQPGAIPGLRAALARVEVAAAERRAATALERTGG